MDDFINVNFENNSSFDHQRVRGEKSFRQFIIMFTFQHIKCFSLRDIFLLNFSRFGSVLIETLWFINQKIIMKKQK